MSILMPDSLPVILTLMITGSRLVAKADPARAASDSSDNFMAN